MSDISKKICLIGDFGVGKSSLIRRFVEGRFSEQYLSTIGVTISRKKVIVSAKDKQQEQTVQLLIWDIEGKTKFQKISPSYLKSAQGVIIVADCTRPDTIEHISSHLDLAYSVNPQGIKLSIVFNKVDLIDLNLYQNLRQHSQFLNKFPVIPIYNTSAKTGKNVEVMFYQLTQSMIEES